MSWRKGLIRAGFELLGTTRLHRVMAPLTRGIGAIATFHHIRPDDERAFCPNKLLSITPGFLAQVIGRLRERGYDIVTMDEGVRRLSEDGFAARRFAVLTFDDGFRDNLIHALPVLERLDAPGVFFVTSGFAERTARLWWVELEEAVRRAKRIDVMIGDRRLQLDAQSDPAKWAAFRAIYWALRAGPESRLLDVIGDLCRVEGIRSDELVASLCLDWTEIEELARHPLVTIGAHTVSHPMLAKHEEATSRRELIDGKAILEQRLGRPVRHVAYPVGDPTSAGAREFRLAAEAGYVSAVTTRPGVLFPEHRNRLQSLPRISINGHHQTLRELDILFSGAPFVLWNKGRRVARA